MPARGVPEVRQRLRALLARIDERQVPRTLTEVLLIAEGYSALMTPVDTSNLINSRYRTLKRKRRGWEGRLGFTAAYALSVHEAPGELDGQPRQNGNGNYWDPQAEPEFLRKAFEEDGLADIAAAVKRGMRI